MNVKCRPFNATFALYGVTCKVNENQRVWTDFFPMKTVRNSEYPVAVTWRHQREVTAVKSFIELKSRTETVCGSNIESRLFDSVIHNCSTCGLNADRDNGPCHHLDLK